MTLDHSWPFDPSGYRGWLIEFHPGRGGMPAQYTGTSPDFSFDDKTCDITGRFIPAPTRRALTDAIDRSMM